MTKKRLLMKFLKDEGFRPKIDDDDDIVFKCEGKHYFLEINESDASYFRLIFPNFWGIDTPSEEEHALIIMNQVNAEIKVAKLYQRKDKIHAAVEMFIDPMKGFKTVFPRCLACLQIATNSFVEKMQEYLDAEISKFKPMLEFNEDEPEDQTNKEE